MDAEADFRHGDHLLAGGLAFLFQNVVGPDEVVFETVGRDQIDVFVEQVFAFARGQVAHRREAVVLFRRGLFERVFGHDAEFARQLVGIEFGQVAVQRHAVAGDRAAHHRRVRREDGGDVRVVLHQVEAAARGHPFVEVSCDLVGWRAEVLHVAFDHFRGREPEQYRLDVIPLAAERIHAVAGALRFSSVRYGRARRCCTAFRASRPAARDPPRIRGCPPRGGCRDRSGYSGRPVSLRRSAPSWRSRCGCLPPCCRPPSLPRTGSREPNGIRACLTYF